MSQDVIRLDHVTKRYGSFTAVDDLSLAVPQGEFLALLGHNGAGKTTMMKMVLGLTRPTSGSLSVLGAAGGIAGRQSVGFLPENVSFTGGSTGREALRFYARLKGAPKAQVEELLQAVGLAEAGNKAVRTYSKGMRQRLGLAQALLGEPRLLLLDEPTTGLDPMLRQEFYRILRDMKARGVTILLSSHVLTELQLRTDRIAIMRKGRLVACDTLHGLQEAAGLPVRIRVRVPEGGAARAAAQAGEGATVLAANGRSVELGVSLAMKMDALRRLAAGTDGSVEDLDVLPPSLEDVYAHFGGLPPTGQQEVPS